jgi:hypothetical protein
MRILDFAAGFLLGVFGGLMAVYVYRKINPPQRIYVVDFLRLKREGISKAQIAKILEKNTVLIDRRCVLNPAGRDITEEIERALKGQ